MTGLILPGNKVCGSGSPIGETEGVCGGGMTEFAEIASLRLPILAFVVCVELSVFGVVDVVEFGT